MRDLKAAVVIMLLTASLVAGCTGDIPEEDLDAKYEEGYDAGYEDAYDASYDGVAQHQYNEGWDDGWEAGNADSQAEIAGIQATVSGLEATIALMEDQRDSLLALLSESQEFANQTLSLAEAMNETVAGLYIMLGENATLVQQLQSELVIQENLAIHWRDAAENNSANGWSNYLAGTDLSGADLTGALLVGASLYDTVLIQAYLGGVNLTDADMRYADLRDAYLGYADLTGADTYQIRLDGVTWDNTICPDGTNSNDNGNTCVNNL